MARLILGAGLAAGMAITTIQAQIPGRNVNMVSGTNIYDGDPFLQRQNEPSIAASTRNPLHLLGGSNDYRTVDLPFPADGDEETGDAWLGLFKSMDGGQRWASTLLPGYPQDDSDAGRASPLSKRFRGGYEAGADAVVRAGTNGLVYFSGLAFDRGEGGKSGIFLARFIDNNNREAGDPFAYLGTVMVAKSTPGRFLDKPWMAVDIPRADSPTCTITADNQIEIERRSSSKGDRDEHGRRGRSGRTPAQAPPNVQRIKAGAVYVAYTSFTGVGDSLRSEIFMTRSVDCGTTWSTPFRISSTSDPLNQGASLTIDPRDGSVFVAWRRFANTANPDHDGIMVAKLPYGGKRADAPGHAYKFPRRKGRKTGQSLHRIFEHGRVKARPSELADIAEFDQGSSSTSFRSNAYPTTASDGSGRIYLAWTERGFPTGDPAAPAEGARIMMATSRDGRRFTDARAVDDQGQLGHQLMPSLAFGGGKLMLVYYDLRETRADRHGKYVTDAQDTFNNTGIRQTIDIRSAMAAPGDYPGFSRGSVKVSDYLMGVNSKTRVVQPLQVNPPNLPMFRQGTTPFIGDYIDVTMAPAFVPAANGRWAYNTAASSVTPVFHAAWTDNRDVRPPFRDSNGDGNPWNDYTPANMSRDEPARTSLSSPPGTTIPVPACEDGNAGSRNQNVYSARITGGLLAGSPGNAKPLGYVTDVSGVQKLIQRAFVVFAQNATAETRRFRMSIRTQPVGGRASFEQFTPGQLPLTAIEMNVPPRSTASRTVYATSTDANASIPVDVTETTPPDANGVPQSLGLGSTVLLNPDIENPDIENPDIENPDIENPDIENTEVYNPDIENPDIENPDIENLRVANPDIENPDIENPDIENPDIENVRVANPDIENLTITNPDIENPDIENPDIENPDIENPDIENGAVADVTWKVSNTGNTTAAFNVNVFLAQQSLPQGVKTQLILFKTYRTPVTAANDCQLGFQTRNVLVASILNPTFIQPGTGGPPDQNDPSEKNASMWLAPGEEGRITLRVIHDDLPQNLVSVPRPDGTTKLVYIDPAFAPTTSSTPTISSQGVGTEDATAGKTDPPLVTPTGANLFFLQMPGNSVAGAAIAPPVQVQVRDNLTGTAVPGATVTLALGNNPGEATLANFTAITGSVAGVDLGIATFPSLSVSAVGNGYTLVASATTAGVTAQASSTPFDVASPIPPGVVVNTNDSGPGSLRAAMLYANAMPGVQTLTFAIPGEGPAVISPSEALPPITESVIIDGFPQVLEHDGRPVVEVRGQAAWTGFDLEANAITIRGLAITQFGQGVFAFQGYTGHVLEQNYIGTNRFNEDQGNNFGVVWRASNSAIRNNVISGNTGDGLSLVIGASDNLVSGNRIGVGGDGAALPNGNNGVTLYDAANDNTFDGNLIAGNSGVGVDIQKNTLVAVSGTRFRNNTIGLDEAGTAMANLGGGIRLDSAPDTVIGEPGAGNTISGNQVPPVIEGGGYSGGPGIMVVGSTSVADMPVIQANRIGTDAEGNEARPNKFEGVVLYSPARVGGSSLEGRGNRIAGNGVAAIGAGTGVAIVNAGAAGSVVQGNSIGVAAGGAPLGNGYSGITVYGDVQNVLIGGDAAGEANTITGNEAAGVAVYTVGGGDSPQEITIAGNAIDANGGLGIDLDANANSQQTAPVLSNARLGEAGTLVDFAMPGLEGNYQLRFFASPACDPSGSGEGAAFLGVIAANAGAFSLGAIPVGYAITATATDSDGNTSEFSACVVVVNAPTATLTALVPGSPSASQMVTFQGTGLPLFFNPEFSRPRAFFTQGATTAEGFVFFGDSDKWWVRLPAGLAPGAAMVYAADSAGVPASAPFGLTVAATPAAPIITAVLALNGPTVSGGGAACGGGYASLLPTGTATPGQGIGVVAYGIDTSGATAVFTQGANVWEVAADCAMSGLPPGLGVTVTVPLGLAPGPVSVSVKQAVGANTSASSAAVTLTVPAPPAPPLPPMSTVVVPGSAGGGANANRPDAGGTLPVSVGVVSSGQLVALAATGAVTWYGGPDTATPGGTPLVGAGGATFLAPGLPGISLVARIGSGPWTFVGTGPTVLGGPGISGELQLAVNDEYFVDNGGAWSVTVTKVVQWPVSAGGNDKFYATIPTHKSAVAAEASCVQGGGHLASVHSLAENEFIGSLVGLAGAGFPTALIGGVLSGGVWGWTDSTAWDYTNWRAGEPSGDGAALQLWPSTNGPLSGWNDLSDSDVIGDAGYVCKFTPPAS